MKSPASRTLKRTLAARTCAFVLALSLAACGTPHQPVASDAGAAPDPQAAQREAEAERRREVRGRAIGKVAEATARGIGGAALGALGGAVYGLKCGLAAIICSPIGAVVGGIAYGIGAAASTPGLDDALSAAASEPEPAPASQTTVPPATTVSDASPEPAPELATPESGVSIARNAAPGVNAVQSPAQTSAPATPFASAVPQPDETTTTAGFGGLRSGDRWEYRYVDSRSGRTGVRSFEIEQFADGQIVERVELEGGETLTTTHRGGAYLEMHGGMQFAPYYTAYTSSSLPQSMPALEVFGGDACEQGPKTIYRTAECEVNAEHLGSETVTVPAGTFETQLVRVKVRQEMWGSAVAYLNGPVAEARYWISPAAGRIVRAEIRYDLERPWTETMELVFYRRSAEHTTAMR